MQILYADKKYIRSFYQAVDSVARERIHLERVEAGDFSKIESFQLSLIASNSPSYYAIETETVVGWVDICPGDNPRIAHRGTLGMGVVESHRGKGLGTKLLTKALEHCPQSHIKKVELVVYEKNYPALSLYRKLGFREVGISENYRKLDGIYYNAILMEKVL